MRRYEWINRPASVILVALSLLFNGSSAEGQTNRFDGAYYCGQGDFEYLKQLDFARCLAHSDLGDSYEAAHARLAFEAFTTVCERRKLLAEGKLKPLPEPSQAAADQSYVDTATKLGNGLDAILKTYEKSERPAQRKIAQIWQAISPQPPLNE